MMITIMINAMNQSVIRTRNSTACLYNKRPSIKELSSRLSGKVSEMILAVLFSDGIT